MTTPIDEATLLTRLTAARDAYHKLRTGSLREVVDHNGTRIQYTRADADALKGYISELESALDVTEMPRSRRRAIVNVFIT